MPSLQGPPQPERAMGPACGLSSPSSVGGGDGKPNGGDSDVFPCLVRLSQSTATRRLHFSSDSEAVMQFGALNEWCSAEVTQKAKPRPTRVPCAFAEAQVFP